MTDSMSDGMIEAIERKIPLMWGVDGAIVRSLIATIRAEREKCVCSFCNYHRQFDPIPAEAPTTMTTPTPHAE